jgi:cell division protein FtsI/penicillin-binding protein 2
MFTMDRRFKTLAIQKNNYSLKAKPTYAKDDTEEDTKCKEQGGAKLLVLLFIWNKH